VTSTDKLSNVNFVTDDITFVELAEERHWKRFRV